MTLPLIGTSAGSSWRRHAERAAQIGEHLVAAARLPAAAGADRLISAGDLNGFELGSSVLNPYESFRSLQPTRFIQNGVFWFDGTFTVPLASALPNVESSALALKRHDIPQALAEAQQAELLAPGEIEPELALGDTLTAAGRTDEARAAYTRASQKIETMEPDARQIWRKELSDKLARLAPL